MSGVRKHMGDEWNQTMMKLKFDLLMMQTELDDTMSCY